MSVSLDDIFQTTYGTSILGGEFSGVFNAISPGIVLKNAGVTAGGGGVDQSHLQMNRAAARMAEQSL